MAAGIALGGGLSNPAALAQLLQALGSLTGGAPDTSQLQGLVSALLQQLFGTASSPQQTQQLQQLAAALVPLLLNMTQVV